MASTPSQCSASLAVSTFCTMTTSRILCLLSRSASILLARAIQPSQSPPFGKASHKDEARAVWRT